MTAAKIAEVKARFQAGMHTDADFCHLLSHAEETPDIGETLELLSEAGREFDRMMGGAA